MMYLSGYDSYADLHNQVMHNTSGQLFIRELRLPPGSLMYACMLVYFSNLAAFCLNVNDTTLG